MTTYRRPPACPPRYAGAGSVLAGILLLLLSPTLHAANVRANSPYGVQDGAAVPIVFTPGSGENVASLQFRLEYNTRQFSISQVQIGGGLRDAGKDLIFAEHNGYTTLIIAGLNQTNIPEGLLATVYLEPLGSNPFPFDLELTTPVFADPQGNAIAFSELPTEEDPDNSPDPDPTPGDDKGEDGEGAPVEEPAETPPPTDTPDPVAQPNRPYYDAPLSGNGSRASVDSDTTDQTASNVPSGPPSANLPTQGGSPGQSRLPDLPQIAPSSTEYSGPMPPQVPTLRNARPPAPRLNTPSANAAAPGLTAPEDSSNSTSGLARGSVALKFPALPDVSADAPAKGSLDELRSATQQAVQRASESPAVPLVLLVMLVAAGALAWRRLKARR